MPTAAQRGGAWPERGRIGVGGIPLCEFLQRVRSRVHHPLIVGFGISRPEHVARLRDLADGAIVASALADIIEKSADADIESNIRAYLGDIKAACQPTFTLQA